MKRVVVAQLVLLAVALALLLTVFTWAAHAAAPPSKVVADLLSEKGVLGARCARGPVRDHAPTYLCVVKVRSGCVGAIFQYRHGELGWYGSSARRVTCWKVDGGPTS